MDGLNVLDAKNPALKPQREPGKSILHVPSNPPAVWDWQEVPHGTIHSHGYASKALGRPREVMVYTPPGYEKSGEKKYPLLVLQHGSGDNQRTWTEHGKAHWILDNLIAQGKSGADDCDDDRWASAGDAFARQRGGEAGVGDGRRFSMSSSTMRCRWWSRSIGWRRIGRIGESWG